MQENTRCPEDVVKLQNFTPDCYKALTLETRPINKELNKHAFTDNRHTSPCELSCNKTNKLE